MIQTFRKNTSLLVAFLIFGFFTTWWILIHNTALGDTLEKRQIYSALYGLMALYGGILGLGISKRWGGFKSLMGKAVLFLSIGLLLQEFGQLAYSLYSYVLHVEIPYPSLGDLGYFGSIPCYIYGGFMLAKASGVQATLRSTLNKVWVVLIPIAMLLVSYYVFLKEVNVDWSGGLVQKIGAFLTFGYPFGQAIYISIAFLTFVLPMKLLGGVMKNRILFVLFAFLIQYLADFLFLYQINKGTFETANFSEYMYLFAYFVMTIALIGLGTVYDRLKNGYGTNEA